jgi:hypothetical protein
MNDEPATKNTKLEYPDVHARESGFKDKVKFCECIPSTVLAYRSIIVVRFGPGLTVILALAYETLGLTVL